eukprot:scaffold521_cov167-Amphora_coffeaeformis.AAC.4
MTVIGNLKRIARRPSLLLKGSSHKTCATNGSDSDEQDGFDSPSVKQPISHDIHFEPPPSMYGYESSIPKARNGGRRASTGGGTDSCMPSDQTTTPLGLTKAQAGRIERARNRRRSSLTMFSSSEHGTFSTYSARLEVAPSERQRHKYEEASPAWKRRHSLDYGKNLEQPPTPLYSIRPDPFCAPRKPACRRNSLSKSNNQGLTQGSWQNLGSARSVRSAESIRSIGTQQSTRSIGTQHSTKSNGTHHSGGSTFTSTGWSVNGAPESPRRRASPKLSLEHVTAHGGAGGIGSRLYAMGREESARSVDTLDSVTSFGE